jgi:hypothetical protein
LTATEVRSALATYIERSGDYFPGFTGPLQELAAYVLSLPDDDMRLVTLAAAYAHHYTVEDFPVGGNLGMRCGGFGRGLWAGDEPERWITEYVESEVAVIRSLHRRADS